MICLICNNAVAKCTCADREERMRQASDHPNVAIKWCIICDKSYHYCTCPVPHFKVRHGGKIEDISEFTDLSGKPVKLP